MIYDCFTFYDELDLLELRLEILDAVVDRFVLCESPFTFRGDPKPLAFANAGDRFAKWRDRIIALVYPKPADTNPWINEWGQRDHLIAGLADCAGDDLVLIGDCDEIPDPANVALRPARGNILVHRQRYSEGYVNRVSGDPWPGTRSIAAGDIARYHSLSEVRKRPLASLESVDGGWHFTSLGGSAVREKKIRSSSHSEVDIRYYRDLRRIDVTFAHTGGGARMAIDATFPDPIRNDPRWARYIWPGPSITDLTQAAALEHAHGCLAYVPDDAPGVAVVARDPQAWDIAGAERFGDRWRGVAARAGEIGVPSGGWVLVDELERCAADTLERLGERGLNAVALARNVRSFATVSGVLAGSAYPPGAPLGLIEYHARITAAGYTLAQTDLLRNPDAFVVWDSMPETMYGVTIGAVGIGEIARDDLRIFLTDAFIFVLELPN
jgi:beta-1,4-mannosyl-glycoprotein beta-1,4-N-acetylglucosaminyltransferase